MRGGCRSEGKPLDVSTLLQGSGSEVALRAYDEARTWTSSELLYDIVPIDSEIFKAVASFQVPSSLALNETKLN
jgi:hypothetical protein